MSRLLRPALLGSLLLTGCSEYGLDTFDSHSPPASRQRPRSVATEEEAESYGDTAAPNDPPPEQDTGVPDTGVPDTGVPDTGVPDTGVPDTGVPDTEETTTEYGAEVCEDSIGDDCNGDMGYGDQCDAEDNTNGCSDEKFWAWCNRRNPAYPDIWYQFLYDWVDDRCDGYVALEDDDGDGYETFICLDSSGVVYSCTTPLVLQFSIGAEVKFTPVAHSFPLDTKTSAYRYDWPTSQTPWLAFDRNRNGRIDDGSELFGSSTPLPSGARADHGFAALAPLDSDGDGRVSVADPGFAGLLLWADVDGDGASDPSELRPAGDAGVVSLALQHRDEPRCDGLGNCERERARFEFRGPDGTIGEGAVVDVYVRSRPAAGPQASAMR